MIRSFYQQLPRSVTTPWNLEDERLEPTTITHEKKGKWSEPNLHGIMFQPLISGMFHWTQKEGWIWKPLSIGTILESWGTLKQPQPVHFQPIFGPTRKMHLGRPNDLDFWRWTPPKMAFSNQNKGHLGSRYIDA